MRLTWLEGLRWIQSPAPLTGCRHGWIPSPARCRPGWTRSPALLLLLLLRRGGFSASELQTLRDWGGYSPVYVDDEKFLDAFGFGRTTVPGYFKGIAKWFINGDLGRQDLINALSYLEGRGVLG